MCVIFDKKIPVFNGMERDWVGWYDSKHFFNLEFKKRLELDFKVYVISKEAIDQLGVTHGNVLNMVLKFLNEWLHF